MICCTLIALIISLPAWGLRAIRVQSNSPAGWKLLVPNRRPKNYLARRIESFGHALRGLASVIRTEPHARIHLFVAFSVIALGFLAKLSTTNWMVITGAIMLVWITETINTAIEHLCDLVSPEYHPLVKLAKDVAAGAVLLSALNAVIIGALIFSNLDAGTIIPPR